MEKKNCVNLTKKDAKCACNYIVTCPNASDKIAYFEKKIAVSCEGNYLVFYSPRLLLVPLKHGEQQFF